MRNFTNIGDEFRTKIAKTTIPKDTYVKTISSGAEYVMADEFGNKEIYQLRELTAFAMNINSMKMIDIEMDGDALIEGYEHLTPNVRSGLKRYRLHNDFLYCPNFGKQILGFKYQFEELTNTQVISILLNEILYGVQPNLQSSSLVGSDNRYLDGEPNYHNGTYLLNNNKTYSMSWCGGVVKMQEGNQGGWYSKDGKVIHKGKFDYQLYRTALVNFDALYQLERKSLLFEEYPEILEIITNKIKNNPKYKFSYE